MKALRVEQLGFEITRKCNMRCAHCMRGDPQCKDISKDVIDKTLDNVASINTLLLTGGEISLNLEAIRYILQACKERNIMVYNFYAVTNGKVVTSEFIMAMCEWYLYTCECGGDPMYNGLALSSDIFHEDIPDEHVNWLRCLSFFREDDKDTDWHQSTLINLGNARNLVGYRKRDPNYQNFSLYVDSDENEVVVESMLVVTVDGDVLSDCDYEYESTDEINVGNVHAANWVKNIIRQYEMCC